MLLIDSFLITMKGYPVPEVISVSTHAAKELLTKAIFIVDNTKRTRTRGYLSSLHISFPQKDFPRGP